MTKFRSRLDLIYNIIGNKAMYKKNLVTPNLNRTLVEKSEW